MSKYLHVPTGQHSLSPRLRFMRKGTTLVSLVICLFACQVILAACGGSSTNGPSVTLKIIQWSNPQESAMIKQLATKFHQLYPNITVQDTAVPNDQYQQLQQSRMTAKDVDLMAVQALAGAPQSYTPGAQKPVWLQWVEAGQLMDLTGQPFLQNYYPQSLANASTYNGKVYTVTTGSYAYSGVFYNKSMFSQYNLAVPTTWNELVQDCQILQSHGIAPFTIGQKDGWPLTLPADGILSDFYPDLSQLNQDLWSGKVKWDDPNMIQVFTRVQDLMKFSEKGITGIDSQTAASRFAAGKTAMLITGMWDGASVAQANPSMKFGYMPIPGSDDATANNQFTGKYDFAWTVPANTPHKDAALKWLSFFSQKDNYTTWVNTLDILPSQPDIAITAPFLKEVAPTASTFKPGWDQISVGPPNQGQYSGLSVTFLSPAGPISDPVVLAHKAEADWAASLKADGVVTQ